MLAPLGFVATLAKRLRYEISDVAIAISVVLVLLLTVRAIAGYGKTRRRLNAFRVGAHVDHLEFETFSEKLTVPRSAIERITEITGPLGGLRIELQANAHPAGISRFDVPRDGPLFAVLRARLQSWAPLVSSRRKTRSVRVGLGIAAILAFFFLPFVIDDVLSRSRPLPCLLVLALWLLLRFLLRARHFACASTQRAVSRSSTERSATERRCATSGCANSRRAWT